MSDSTPQVMPLVSVVIPVFNGEEYIRIAIDSALGQGYENLEVIVVDDGSTDGTWDQLQEYPDHARVKIHTHDDHVNRGVSRSRRLGVEASSGKYVAFLDADDYFLEGKIVHQVELLENTPAAVMCHGNILPVNEGSESPDFVANFSISDSQYQYSYQKQDYYLERNRVCNSTCMVRKSNLASLQFGPPQLFQYEDFYLWILLARQGEFVFTPRPLTGYRFHGGSSTSKLVKNELVDCYSKVEFCLSLLARPEGREDSAKLQGLLKEYLGRLMALYSIDESEHTPDLIRALFNNHEDTMLNKIYKKLFPG